MVSLHRAYLELASHHSAPDPDNSNALDMRGWIPTWDCQRCGRYVKHHAQCFCGQRYHDGMPQSMQDRGARRQGTWRWQGFRIRQGRQECAAASDKTTKQDEICGQGSEILCGQGPTAYQGGGTAGAVLQAAARDEFGAVSVQDGNQKTDQRFGDAGSHRS
eukprot:2663488-Pyramimonas_sp.AAC.1